MLTNSFLTNETHIRLLFLSDNLTVTMVFLTVAISFLTSCTSESQAPFLFGIFIFCIAFFTRRAVIVMYIRYEIVILPLIALIITRGWYRERLYATLVILGYTLLFSLPAIVIIIILEGSWTRKIPFVDIRTFMNF